ncbi:hypothetical protein C8R46DRAFT_1303193 [Mycena filopes]|nr:hypothetical protein C8R46DRAFT_1303193 [Mycena filopes]
MHPAFRLENLDALSPALQDAASQLMEGKNPRLLPGQLLVFNLSVDAVRSLLPVWYENLDPVYIPTVGQIDAALIADHRIDHAVAAVYALRALVMLRDTREGIYSKLWTRTWLWIEFLHTCAECLNALPPKTELYGIFVAVFVQFQAHGCRAPVESTPGVRTIVGAAWEVILEGTDEQALRNVSFFLNFDERKCRPKRLKEYMGGAGGGMGHFASILRRHVDRAVGDPAIPMSDMGRTHFTAAIEFMTGTKDVPEFRLPFRDALLRTGILGTLTTAITSLVPSPTEGDDGLHILTSAFNLLLQSGSLRAFALAASTHPGHYFLDHELQPYVEQLLAPYLVYRSILLLMPRCLSEVEDLIKTDGFKASAILPQWQTFYRIAQDRLALLQSSDAAPAATMKSCDNLEIYIIAQEHVKARIGAPGIEELAGSSQLSGDHQMCFFLAAEERQLTLPDKAFLRHLLFRDYLALRPEIYAARIAVLTAAPTRIPYVLFDYMHGPPTVTVRSWPKNYAGFRDHPHSWIARYHNHGFRAVRSLDRIEVHLMAIPNGLKTHWKVFPMRHADWEIPNTLWTVVDKLKGVEAGEVYDTIVAEGIAPLLASTPASCVALRADPELVRLEHGPWVAL